MFDLTPWIEALGRGETRIEQEMALRNAWRAAGYSADEVDQLSGAFNA